MSWKARSKSAPLETWPKNASPRIRSRAKSAPAETGTRAKSALPKTPSPTNLSKLPANIKRTVFSKLSPKSKVALGSVNRESRAILSGYNNEKPCNIEDLRYFVDKTMRASNRSVYPRIKGFDLDFSCNDGKSYNMYKKYQKNYYSPPKDNKRDVVSGKGTYTIKNVINFPQGAGLEEYKRMLTTEPQPTAWRSIKRSAAADAGGVLATDVIWLAIKNYTSRLYPFNKGSYAFKMKLRCTSMKTNAKMTVTVEQNSEFVEDETDYDRPRRVAREEVLVTAVNNATGRTDEFVQTDPPSGTAFARRYEDAPVGTPLHFTDLKTLVVNSGWMECFYPIPFELPTNGTIDQFKQVFQNILKEHKENKQPPPLSKEFIEAKAAEAAAAAELWQGGRAKRKS